MIPRSYLYVPGNQPDKLAKAAGRGADALIVDLEDAVPPDAKESARTTVRQWLASSPGNTPVWVRVNPGPLLDEDLAALKGRSIAGLVLPKASMSDLDRLSLTAVIALLETAEGILDSREIAAVPHVCRLAIGEADLGAELGIAPSPGAPEMAHMRSLIVLASAAAGLPGPIGPVSTDFRDLEVLRSSTIALRRMGFGARSAIHPAQVSVINGCFTPSEEEVESARSLLESFERAGGGAAVDDAGRMIDEAVIRSARRTLEGAPEGPGRTSAKTGGFGDEPSLS